MALPFCHLAQGLSSSVYPTAPLGAQLTFSALGMYPLTKATLGVGQWLGVSHNWSHNCDLGLSSGSHGVLVSTEEESNMPALSATLGVMAHR